MPNPRIEPLKKVLVIDPNDEVAWFGLGKAYMEDNNWQEAVPALQSCITGQTYLFSSLLCTGAIAAETRTFGRVPTGIRSGHRGLHKKRRCDGDKKSGSVEKHATCVTSRALLRGLEYDGFSLTDPTYLERCTQAGLETPRQCP